MSNIFSPFIGFFHLLFLQITPSPYCQCTKVFIYSDDRKEETQVSLITNCSYLYCILTQKYQSKGLHSFWFSFSYCPPYVQQFLSDKKSLYVSITKKNKYILDITLFENKFNSNTICLKISLITVVPCILGHQFIKTNSFQVTSIHGQLSELYISGSSAIKIAYRLTFELSLSVTKGIIWWKSKVNVVSGYIYLKKIILRIHRFLVFRSFSP